jgi:hypothetical protein
VLAALCIEHGFCLPPMEIERLVASPPTSVTEFTEAALVAEGYGFTKSDPLCIKAGEVVARAFIQHLAERTN